YQRMPGYHHVLTGFEGVSERVPAQPLDHHPPKLRVLRAERVGLRGWIGPLLDRSSVTLPELLSQHHAELPTRTVLLPSPFSHFASTSPPQQSSQTRYDSSAPSWEPRSATIPPRNRRPAAASWTGSVAEERFCAVSIPAEAGVRLLASGFRELSSAFREPAIPPALPRSNQPLPQRLLEAAARPVLVRIQPSRTPTAGYQLGRA